MKELMIRPRYVAFMELLITWSGELHVGGDLFRAIRTRFDGYACMEIHHAVLALKTIATT